MAGVGLTNTGTSANDPLSTSIKPPSKQVIALAISVVNSKPPNISIGEYIRLLRFHIAKGAREHAISSTHHHLDRSSYWRSEYERVKNLEKTREDENVDLRLQIDALTAKLDATKPAAPSKKRKKQDADVIPYPRSPKRTKPNAAVDVSSGLAFDESTEIALGDGGETGNALLRALYHLHIALKRRSDVDSVALSSHVVEAASKTAAIVEQSSGHFADQDSQNIEDFKPILALCKRAVASILAAYGRLEPSAEGNNTQGQAVYAIVQMFRGFVAAFTTLSSTETRKAIASEVPTQKASLKTKLKAPRPFNIKELPSLSVFTNFLEGIISMLNPNIDAHKPLFEGFAYCVLQILGTRLHQTVFGDARAPTIEAEIMKSIAVDEIDDEGPSADSMPQNKEQRQGRLEGPYLIHLLNHVMKAAPSYLGLIQPTNGRAKLPTVSGLKRGTLTVEAKNCLQRTLVNCIFGTEGVNENDPLSYCLKMPVKTAASLTMPKIKETEVPDWFESEMWRLLGWDILSKEGEW